VAHLNGLRTLRHRSLTTITLGLAVAATAPAAAADGCLVLLCLAAPSWRNVAQCVDPVRQVLRDLARGRPFPSCAMAGSGNNATHQWSQAPGYCPPQYTRSTEGVNGPIYSCDFSGAVEVNVGGALWARTWWNPSGESVTEFSAAAKARLGSWDSRFDDDYAAWLPLPVDPCATC
jgi:hypothetical protein